MEKEKDMNIKMQNAALKVWQSIGRFDAEKGSWTSWLTAVARNAALDMARAEKRREAGELPEDAHDPAPTPEETALRKERQEALLRALETLSSGDRVLFYRKYYYRQPTAQIAAELGATERSVEGRLYRIRQKLKELLKGEMS